VEPQCKLTELLRRVADDDRAAFAADLEKGAASAYLPAVPLFDSHDLAKAVASILGAEAMHWSVLLKLLGENPSPVAFNA
jgi:hypothetical protein